MGLPIKREEAEQHKDNASHQNVLALHISTISHPHEIQGSFVTKEFMRRLEGIMVDSAERNFGKIKTDNIFKKYLANAVVDYIAPASTVVSIHSQRNYVTDGSPQLNLGDSVKLLTQAAMENVELYLSDKMKYAANLARVIRPKDKPLKFGAPDPEMFMINVQRTNPDQPALPGHK